MANTRQNEINTFVSHLRVLQDLGYAVPAKNEIDGLIKSDMGIDYIVKTNHYMSLLHGYKADMKQQLDISYTINLDHRGLVQARMNAFDTERKANHAYYEYEVTANKQAAAPEIKPVHETLQKSLKEYQKNCIANIATLTAGYYAEENTNFYNSTEESYNEMLKKGAEIKRDREKKLKVKIHGLDEHRNIFKSLQYDVAYNQSAKQEKEAVHTVATVYDIKAEENNANNSVTYKFDGPAWVFHILATPEERLQFFKLLYEDIVDRHFKRPVFNPNPQEKVKFQLATARDFLKAQREEHKRAIETIKDNDDLHPKSTLPFVELSPSFIERMEAELEKKRTEESRSLGALSRIFSSRDPSELSADELEKQLNEIKRSQSEIRFLTDRADTLEERKAEDQKLEEKVKLQITDREYNQAIHELDLNNSDKPHKLEKLYEPINESNNPAVWDANLILEIQRQKTLAVGDRNNQENTNKKQKLIAETEEKYWALDNEQVQESKNNEQVSVLAKNLSFYIETRHKKNPMFDMKKEEITLAEREEYVAHQACLTVERELKVATEAVVKLNHEDKGLKNQNSLLDTANQKLEQDCNRIQGDISTLEVELNLCREQLSVLLLEIMSDKRQLEELDLRFQKDEERHNLLDQQIAQNEQEVLDFDLRIGGVLDQIDDLPGPAPSENEEEKQSDPAIDHQREDLLQQMMPLLQEQLSLSAKITGLKKERENLTNELNQQQQERDTKTKSIAEKESSLNEISQKIQCAESSLRDQQKQNQESKEIIDINRSIIYANQKRLNNISQELLDRKRQEVVKELIKINAQNELQQKSQALLSQKNELSILQEDLLQLNGRIQEIRDQLLEVDPQKKAERLAWLRWLMFNGINEILETPGDMLTAVPVEFNTEYGAQFGFDELVKHYADKAKKAKESFDKLLSKNNKNQFNERLYKLHQALALGNIMPERYHTEVREFEEDFRKYKAELDELNNMVQAMAAFSSEINGRMPDNEPETEREKALVREYASLRHTLFSMTGNQDLIRGGEVLTGPAETLEAYINACNQGLPYREKSKELGRRIDNMRYKGEARDKVPYSLNSLQRPFKEEDGSSVAIEDAKSLETELSAVKTTSLLSFCHINEATQILEVNTAIASLNELKNLQTAEPINLYSSSYSFEPREGLGLQLQRIEETLEACYTNAQKFHKELYALDQARLALEDRYPDDANKGEGSIYETEANQLKQHALRIQLQLVEISAVAEVARNRYKRLTPANCRFPYWSNNSNVTGAADTHSELKYHEIHAPRINRLFYYLSGEAIYRHQASGQAQDEQPNIVKVLNEERVDYDANMFLHGSSATADPTNTAALQGSPEPAAT